MSVVLNPLEYAFPSTEYIFGSLLSSFVGSFVLTVVVKFFCMIETMVCGWHCCCTGNLIWHRVPVTQARDLHILIISLSIKLQSLILMGTVVINLLLMIAWFNSVEIVHQTINLTGEASRNNSQNQ